MITTCIIDNNLSFTEFLKGELNSYGTYDVLYSAAFSNNVEEDLKDILGNIDLLILGLNTDPNYMAMAERVMRVTKAKYKLILHDITDGYVIMNILSLGVNGLISKLSSPKSMVQYIQDSIANKHFICPWTSGHLIDYLKDRHKVDALEKLTKKQKQITDGLLRGLSYREIAALNGISINTVNDYLKRIYKILHISSRSELQARFNKNVNSLFI